MAQWSEFVVREPAEVTQLDESALIPAGMSMTAFRPNLDLHSTGVGFGDLTSIRPNDADRQPDSVCLHKLKLNDARFASHGNNDAW
jgi:hypothetical protein